MYCVCFCFESLSKKKRSVRLFGFETLLFFLIVCIILVNGEVFLMLISNESNCFCCYIVVFYLVIEDVSMCEGCKGVYCSQSYFGNELENVSVVSLFCWVLVMRYLLTCFDCVDGMIVCVICKVFYVEIDWCGVCKLVWFDYGEFC